MNFKILEKFKIKFINPFPFEMKKEGEVSITKIYDPINEEFVKISGISEITEPIEIKTLDLIKTDMSAPISVGVNRFSRSVAPRKNRNGGFDILSPVNGELNPLEITPIDSRISFIIPEGFEGIIKSDPDISSRFAVVVSDSPRVINKDDKKSIVINLNNISNDPYKIKKGRKIAEFEIRDKKEIK